MMVLSNLYGGGMSSRLFQQVREERGLLFYFSLCPDVYRYRYVRGLCRDIG